MPRREPPGKPLTELLQVAEELQQVEEAHERLRQSTAGAIRSARLNAGLTVTDLADALGATSSYVSQVESGHRKATSEQLNKFYVAITSSTGGATVSDVSSSWTVSPAQVGEPEEAEVD